MTIEQFKKLKVGDKVIINGEENEVHEIDDEGCFFKKKIREVGLTYIYSDLKDTLCSGIVKRMKLITNEPHYKQYIGKKYAVHCKTQEEWDRFCDKADATNLRWCDKTKPSNHKEYFAKGRTPYIYLNEAPNLVRGESSKSYTILSVAEFFGEEETPKTISEELNEMGSPDHVDAMSYMMMGRDMFSIESINRAFNIKNKPNKVKKFMTNIVDHAKFALLSPEEKELRNAGLKDSEGNFTFEAREIAYGLEAKERGYKNMQEISDKIGRPSSYEFSDLECITILKKFEKELLETAKAYNKDQKKK